MVLDVLDAVVLVAAAGDDGKVAERLHGEELARQDLADPVGVREVLLREVDLGQDEDGALAARVHLGNEVGDVAPLGVHRAILDAQDDGVRVGHVVLRELLNVRLRLRIHARSHGLKS